MEQSGHFIMRACVRMDAYVERVNTASFMKYSEVTKVVGDVRGDLFCVMCSDVVRLGMKGPALWAGLELAYLLMRRIYSVLRC